jgi:uncharacterized protein YjbI with pentapeptide repeats
VCRNADATYADFSHANLTNADFNRANASGADFREANLTNVTFFAATLIGANLARQSFTNVELYRANMSNADFTGADLTGADNLSYAYFSSATLTGANLSRSSLWGASFSGATLTEADLTEAYVHGSRYVDGANFSSTTSSGFTASQLYSTASYQRHNLTGIGLNSNNLSGWNFAGQNLNNAWLSGTILTGADFTAADARGADLYIEGGAITTNVIQRDGHINGLDLDADRPLVVRDDDGVNFSYPFSRFRPPISITVDQHFMMGPGGTLRMVFEGDAWDSSISFALGIPVTLGGTLELTFADYVNLASQVGRTFDLFDWTGVTPTGAFAISSPYTWDISKLYTTGEVTLAAVPEPTTFALFTVAIIGLTLYRRRNVL